MRKVLFIAAAIAAVVAAYFLFEGMLAQVLLSGISDEQVQKSRMLAWLIYCPAAGILVLTAAYLIRRAVGLGAAKMRTIHVGSKAWMRLVLLPCAWVLLCGSLYFADLAWYVGQHRADPGFEGATQTGSGVAAIALLGASVVCLVFARKRSA